MSNEPASSPVNDAPSADGQPGDLCGGQGLSRRSLLMGGAGLALTAGYPLSAVTAAYQTQPRLQQAQTQAQAADTRPQTETQTQVQEKGVRPQTLAEGNLYIPRAIREAKVSLHMKDVPGESLIKELFRQAKAPCQVIGKVPHDITGFDTQGEGITFEPCFSMISFVQTQLPHREGRIHRLPSGENQHYSGTPGPGPSLVQAQD